MCLNSIPTMKALNCVCVSTSQELPDTAQRRGCSGSRFGQGSAERVIPPYRRVTDLPAPGSGC